MGTILRLKRHHYVAAISIFLISLIVVALTAWIAGCGQPVEYTPMVAAGDEHTVGLRSDGTVVAVGDNTYGQCDVGGWNLS